MLTTEQVKEIRAAMTWGDQVYGRRQAKGDDQLMVAHAFHRRAKEMALVDPGGTFEAFLDLVTMEDLNAALEDDERDPTSEDGTT